MPLLRPQEIYVRVLTLGLVNVTLLGERVFAGVIKGSEMRSSWIIWTGPNSTDKCLYKRQKRREFPGGPVVGLPCFSLPKAGLGSIPGSGTKILKATMQPKKEKKK